MISRVIRIAALFRMGGARPVMTFHYEHESFTDALDAVAIADVAGVVRDALFNQWGPLASVYCELDTLHGWATPEGVWENPEFVYPWGVPLFSGQLNVRPFPSNVAALVRLVVDPADWWRNKGSHYFPGLSSDLGSIDGTYIFRVGDLWPLSGGEDGWQPVPVVGEPVGRLREAVWSPKDRIARPVVAVVAVQHPCVQRRRIDPALRAWRP